MKKIKLINDENRLVLTQVSKACSRDICLGVDAAVCVGPAVDICKYDHASCAGDTEDYCSGYDLVPDPML